MNYLFTSESVSEGHPDKIADQISDAMLDEFLKYDPDSRVACETFCTTGLVVVGGEITSKGEGKVNVDRVVRRTIKNIGYTKASYKFDSESCGVISTVHNQSSDISQGVTAKKGLHKEQGAGDQGMMFGYATSETENYIPVTLWISNLILKEMAKVRREGKVMKYLGPDSKSQVTAEYDNRDQPQSIHTIVVSTQHDNFIEPVMETPREMERADNKMLEKIRRDVIDIIIYRVIRSLPTKERKLFRRDWKERIVIHVNPTGKFVVGGPHGDVGLTGRKIIVDTYGGRGSHGGGAFSGKDSSKVDRSAAYAARYMAKNLVASGVCKQAQVQLSYAIGIAEPINIYVNTFKTAKVWIDGKKLTDTLISKMISGLFDLRPAAIIEKFGLKNPIFLETASYGHFGQTPEVKEVEVYYKGDGVTKERIDGKDHYFKKVETFGWEKLDKVDEIIKIFGLDEARVPLEDIYKESLKTV